MQNLTLNFNENIDSSTEVKSTTKSALLKVALNTKIRKKFKFIH